ncbi:MAG: RNA-binding protein S1, partial [Clostridiales bacterium]|nr:RNA-binding protein S1 [Clostridiales bacterium]
KDYLKENQDVKVKVLSISDDGKISLSIKQAMEQPKAEERPQRSQRPAQRNNRSSSANVWQGTKTVSNENMSFEDMMAKFKQVSDEKMTDLKRATEGKHGGFSRRGTANRP